MTVSEASSVVYLDPSRRLTPAEVEERFAVLNNELDRAVKALETARRAELGALKEYGQAKYRLLASRDCPVPLTSRSVTNTHREEWVNSQIPDLWADLRQAEADRWAAHDYARALEVHISLTQSVGNLAKQAFDLGGRRGW